MNAFEVYRTYLALKRHFTSNYDYFKYNGKTNVSIASFEKRRDKHLFVKLAKHNDPFKLLLANVVHNPGYWVGDSASSKVYDEWRRRTESLSYLFGQDLEKLEDKFSDNFLDDARFFQKKISFETFTILVDLLGLEAYYSPRTDDPLLLGNLEKARKYCPFLKYDRAKFSLLLIKRFGGKPDAFAA